MIDCAKSIKEGTCVGECCGIGIPFELEMFKANKHLITRKHKEFLLDNQIYTLSKDMFCVFLGKDKRCMVYEQRPSICRRYGYEEGLHCPHFKPSGNMRSEASKKQIYKKIDALAKKAFGRRPWL